jgi:chromosome segregation protein
MQILMEEDTQILIECSQWQKEEEEVNQQLHGLAEIISPAEVVLAKLEIEQHQYETADNEARQTLRIAEHNYSQARITFAHEQDVLESLQRKIEDDLGLVDFVYEETIGGRSPLPISGLVDKLPVIKEISPDLEEIIKRQKAQLNRIGAINSEALTEYQQVKERYEFLNNQLQDLQAAEEDVKEVIVELDELMETEFRKTFDRVAVEFRHIFTRLFGGGSAQLH